MSYLGDFLAGTTDVTLKFNTASFADGSPITLAGTPVVKVYKKGSTTESTAGITLTVDYDSRTGYHDVTIDTSADGTFYAAGNDFSVVITTGTVGGTSVIGREIGSFSLENRTQKADVRKLLGTAWLTPGTAGTPDVNAKLINAVSTSSVTTINANLGTTQAVAFNANNFQKVSLNDILAVTLTETSGQLAGGFKKFFNVGSPASTMELITAVTTVTTTTTATNLTNAPTAGDFTATMKTSIGTAVAASAVASVTAGVTLAANQHVIVDSGTVTTVTNQLTAAQIATGVWQDTTAGDFTTALSVGKSLMNGVSLGTGLTVARCTLTDTLTTYTGNTVQTGNVFTLIGSTGSGLTSLAPSSTALSTAQWTNALATNLGTLAGHDPGATLGTSTLTQAQVTGGAYSVQSASCVLGDARLANLDRAISAIVTTAMTESYNADGSPPTPAQALMLILQRLTEFAIVGSTITINKLAGPGNVAAVLTLDQPPPNATSSTRTA